MDIYTGNVTEVNGNEHGFKMQSDTFKMSKQTTWKLNSKFQNSNMLLIILSPRKDEVSSPLCTLYDTHLAFSSIGLFRVGCGLFRRCRGDIVAIIGFFRLVIL